MCTIGRRPSLSLTRRRPGGRPLVVAVAALAITASARGASLSVELDLTDPASGVMGVSFELTDYPMDTITLPLAEPQEDPGAYFTFFEDVAFSSPDGRPVEPSRAADGMFEFTDVQGGISGSYRVLAGELAAAFGPKANLPLVRSDRVIVPLRAVVGLPVELDSPELDLDAASIRFRLPEGWSALTPWPSYHGQVRLRAQAERMIRTGVMAAGVDLDYRDDLEGSPPSLFVHGGGDDAARSELDSVVHRLIDRYVSWFGSAGSNPISVFIEIEPGPADVDGRGPFLRIRCPASLVGLTPPELPFGSEAYRFHHRLAHELFHNWFGASGTMYPSGPEIFWASEGGAEYVAAIALAAAGIAAPETALDYLAGRAGHLARLPDRAGPIDRGADAWSDAGYRDLVTTKGALVCFLLDTQLLTGQRSFTFSNVLGSLHHTAFMTGQLAGMPVTAGLLGERLNSAMGLRGKLLLGNYLTQDILSDLSERARAVGLAWEGDAESGFRLAWAENGPDLFRQAIAVDR